MTAAPRWTTTACGSPTASASWLPLLLPVPAVDVRVRRRAGVLCAAVGFSVRSGPHEAVGVGVQVRSARGSLTRHALPPRLTAAPRALRRPCGCVRLCGGLGCLTGRLPRRLLFKNKSTLEAMRRTSLFARATRSTCLGAQLARRHGRHVVDAAPRHPQPRAMANMAHSRQRAARTACALRVVLRAPPAAARRAHWRRGCENPIGRRRCVRRHCGPDRLARGSQGCKAPRDIPEWRLLSDGAMAMRNESRCSSAPEPGCAAIVNGRPAGWIGRKRCAERWRVLGRMMGRPRTRESCLRIRSRRRWRAT